MFARSCCFLFVVGAAPVASALDQSYSEVIAFNGKLYATLNQTLTRCSAQKISKYSVDSLRNVYDPGEEIRIFDLAADAENAIWNRAKPDELTKLCAESIRVNGPFGSKWLAAR